MLDSWSLIELRHGIGGNVRSIGGEKKTSKLNLKLRLTGPLQLGGVTA